MAGRARSISTEPSTEQWLYVQRVLAREARLAGFVPMAADAFGAVLSQARWRWPSWLKDRSLVVFATDTRLTPDATLALFKLATKDARPHLVVRGITSELWRPRLVSAPMHVHEGAPSERVESPESLIVRAGALIDGGRFVEAEAAARWSLLLSAPADQSPGRCALARSLIGQRRLLEARAALAPLETSEALSLREHIKQVSAEPRTEPAMVESFLDILRTCQESDDAITALSRVAVRLNHALGGVRGRVRDRRSPAATRRRACRRVRAVGLAARGRVARPRYRCRRAIGAARASRGSGVADSLWRDRRWRVVVPLVDGHPAHSAGRRQRPRPCRDRGGARGPRGARTAAHAGHRRSHGSGPDRREQRH